MNNNTFWFKNKFITGFGGSVRNINIFPIKRIIQLVQTTKFFPDIFAENSGASRNPERGRFCRITSGVMKKSFFKTADSPAADYLFAVFRAFLGKSNSKNFRIDKM